jgi:copper(I)-binding protein
MKPKKLFCCVVAITAVFFLTCAHAKDLSKNIFVSQAWVQAMPPSQTTTAAYMLITNNSKREAILASASSDIALATEIHQMSEMNGMMNMVMVPNLHIPAQGKVALQPGGYHIMLINLKKPVKKGDIVSIKLHFKDGTDIVVKAQAKMQQAEGPSSMPEMKM